jgi:hypothetical protein
MQEDRCNIETLGKCRIFSVLPSRLAIESEMPFGPHIIDMLETGLAECFK